MSQKLETYQVDKWTVFGRTSFQPPFKASDELLNDARIIYVIHGHSCLYSANQFFELKSGDLLIMKTDNFVNNWLENENGEPSELIVFQLNSEVLHHIYNKQLPNWLIPEQGPPGQAAEKVEAHPLLLAFFQNLMQYLDHPQHLSNEINQVKIRELLSLLVQTDHSGSVQKIFKNLFRSSSYDFQEIIQKNLFENLSIEDLAFLTRMTLSSFKRKFKAIYVPPPTNTSFPNAWKRHKAS